MGKVMSGLVLGFSVLLLLAAVLVLGAWWLWSSGRSGASAPAGARLLFGAGLGVVVLAVVGASGNLKEGHRTKLLTAFTLVVLAACTAGAVVGFRTFTRWADKGRAVRALGAVCATGRGAPDAPGLQTPPLHAVVMGSRGEEIDWTGHAADWRTLAVSNVELVACASTARQQVDTCLYHPARHPGTLVEVKRYRSVATVQVLATQTGEAVDNFTISNEPPSCPSETTDTSAIVKPVSFQQLSTRLAQVARTGTAGGSE